MSLDVGDKAPDFTLPTDGDGKIKLSDLKGQKVVLYFYPKDDTPGCTKEACAFGEMFPRFKKMDATVIGISRDSVASHDKFKKKYKLPFVIKGIATGEDAKLAVEHGVDVIYVSNHGGRQLDQGAGTMDVLPEIVAAAKGKATIVVDGSICRGTDVLKAIALGADLVCIGRLYAYGMAAAGRDGIIRTLELLQDEMIRDMGLLGVNRMDELSPAYLRAAQPVRPAHVLSAFPYIDAPDDRY